MDLKWVPLLLIPAMAVYVFTGDRGYPRRGAKEWFTYWGLYWLVTAIPLSIMVRHAGQGLMLSLLVTSLVWVLDWRWRRG